MEDKNIILEKIVEQLQMRMETECEVRAGITTKNNGIKMTFISIYNRESNMAPMVYIDHWLEAYRAGIITITDIVEKIFQSYNESYTKKNFDQSFFYDFGMVAPFIRARLVNRELNKAALSNVPHRKFLDLAIVYSVEKEVDREKCMSVRITNNHMEKWQVSEETLYELAMTNMEGEQSWSNLKNIIMEESGENFKENEPEIYVLTNQKRVYGAIEIADERILSKIAENLGRDYIIIPSSVHETLIVPVSCSGSEMNYFVNMVKEVNDSVVLREEILSYHVYKYDSANRRIVIAA